MNIGQLIKELEEYDLSANISGVYEAKRGEEVFNIDGVLSINGAIYLILDD